MIGVRAHAVKAGGRVTFRDWSGLFDICPVETAGHILQLRRDMREATRRLKQASLDRLIRDAVGTGVGIGRVLTGPLPQPIRLQGIPPGAMRLDPLTDTD